MIKTALALLSFSLLAIALPVWNGEIGSGVRAQVANPDYYNIGSPVLQDIWVDPINGNDSNNGNSSTNALRNLSAAWNKIPYNVTLTTTGYRIRLLPGNYAQGTFENYMDFRRGTYQFPIIFEAANGPGTAIFTHRLAFDSVQYLYLLNLNIAPPGITGGNVVHCAYCRNFLVRGLNINGNGSSTRRAREGLKVNQSQYVYVENSNISGASGNSIDFVAVQFGHVLNNKIHNATDWCMYSKGGSASLTIEFNELYNCNAGGYTAGRSTGFEFMVAPWLHYEAYDTKFINNIVHDVDGPGMGVKGGYNVLLAYNTLYRVGRSYSTIEVSFGARTCDDDAATCSQHLAAGGWGHTVVGDVPELEDQIPNRNVFVFNNIIYNPAGYQAATHFRIPGPDDANSPNTGTNIPNPALADQNLRLRGNLIWNGAIGQPLGIGGANQGCAAANSTCNVTQVTTENSINNVQPQLVNPTAGDYRPIAGSNVYNAPTYPLPNFAGNDRAQPPLAPSGNLQNNILRDLQNCVRNQPGPAGAYSGLSCAPQTPVVPVNLTGLAVSSSQIKVTWQDLSDDETGFQLQRSLNDSFSSPVTFNLPANATNYQDASLNLDTTYFYRIRACSSAGCSLYSNIASTRTLKPFRLAFTKFPEKTAEPGYSFKSQPQLGIYDSNGNQVSNYTGNATLAVKAGTGHPAATLNPANNTAITFNNGFATFTGLSINKIGANYQLVATTDEGLTIESPYFNVIGKLLFETQPAANTLANLPLAGTLTVRVVRPSDNSTVSDYDRQVDLSLAFGSSTSGATLSLVSMPGPVQRTPVNGLVSFSNELVVDRLGSSYRLQATSSDPLIVATSEPFNIGGILELSPPFPIRAPTAHESFTITLTLKDGNGETLDYYNESISLVLASNPGSAYLYGNLNSFFQAGIASFQQLAISRPGSGYRLSAAISNLAQGQIIFNVDESVTCDGLLVNSLSDEPLVDTFPTSCNVITLRGAFSRVAPGKIIRLDRNLFSNRVSITLLNSPLPVLPAGAGLDGGCLGNGAGLQLRNATGSPFALNLRAGSYFYGLALGGTDSPSQLLLKASSGGNGNLVGCLKVSSL